MKKRYNGGKSSAGTAAAAILLIVCGVYAIIAGDSFSGGTLTAAGFLLGIGGAVASRKSKKRLDDFVNMITTQKEGMTGDAVSKFPLPMAVLQINGKISWYNDLFMEMLGSPDLYNIVIGDVMPELKWSEILKSSNGIYTYANYKGHHYNVVGDIIKNSTSTDDNPDFSVLLYFIDKTELEALRKKYDEEKTDIAIVNIDNYDEIFQKLDDSEGQQTMASINKYVSEWVAQSCGVMKKTERDRYIVFFEHKYLNESIKNKFSVLEKVRSLGDELKMPITLSIGVGVGGTVKENDAYARAALDIALGRGGDQAAVKDSSQYNFYGGIAKDYERSTRVKTRSFAVALKDFIANSDRVIFMGHSGLDYDAFGAAIGLQRAVRTFGKEPYIVFDSSPAVERLAQEVPKNEEYRGMLISPEAADNLITMNTLLVVLDTHRPSMLPRPSLLERTSKVVVIDHHRRSTESVSNISLTYHEPYASSTCEMVTEILQYIDDNRNMTSFEAKALYMGMLMDTKNFSVKTGVRTFEAASYLRRYGLNTSEVRSLFNVDKDEYIQRAEIIKNSRRAGQNALIGVCDKEYPNIKVVAAQAADEMLNLRGTAAAFVVYPFDGRMCISARSLGNVNVQLITEKLGGGGHATVAGAQLETSDAENAVEALNTAIEEYIKETKKE